MDDQTYTLTAEAGDTDAAGQRSVVLKVRGSLDISARDDLSATIADIVASGCDHVIVDLTGVVFIDSEALAGLIDGYTVAVDKGTLLTATGAQGIVHRVLQITGLLTLLRHP